MQGSSIEALAVRLQRENRRWRTLAALLGLCVIVAMAFGAALPGDLSARRLVLTGVDGKPRAVLAVVNDLPSLSFLDDREKTKLTMGVRRDGTPYADMRDVNDDGALKSRISLGLTKEGDAMLLLRDKAGVARADIQVDRKGGAHIGMANNNGKTVLLIGSGDNGEPSFSLFDNMGTMRLAVVNSADTNSTNIWLGDKNKKLRFQLAVDGDGETSIACFDANQNAIFRAPTRVGP